MSKKSWIITISFFLIICSFIFLLYGLFNYNVRTNVSCLSNGGQYTLISLGSGGKFYCIHTYKDVGKKCHNSNECEGDCLRTQESNEYGICEGIDFPTSGCYPGTFDGTKIAFCI